jgi:polyhydroxybutyrate depolymerase
MLALVLLLFFFLGNGMPVFALPEDGSRSLKMERRSLAYGGLERRYYLYRPHSCDGKTPSPLLILLHGGGSTGKRMLSFTGFDRVAAGEGLIVVCPDGFERHWNDGRQASGHSAHERGVDDVGFIKQLLEKTSAELNIDRKRVYAAGISNGAMMSYRLGLELPDRLAAIAAVAGALPEPLYRREWNGRPLPAIIINGTADPLVPFEGGEVRFYRKRLGRVISVPETVAFWAKHNKCAADPQVVELPLQTHKSGLKVRKTSYANCCPGADLEFYAVEGGGHTWPRDSLFCQYLPVAVIGKSCRDIDSTRLIWDFFKKQALAVSSKE